RLSGRHLPGRSHRLSDHLQLGPNPRLRSRGHALLDRPVPRPGSGRRSADEHRHGPAGACAGRAAAAARADRPRPAGGAVAGTAELGRPRDPLRARGLTCLGEKAALGPEPDCAAAISLSNGRRFMAHATRGIAATFVASTLALAACGGTGENTRGGGPAENQGNEAEQTFGPQNGGADTPTA